MRFILTESKADLRKLVDYAGEELANKFMEIKGTVKSPMNDIYYWLKMPLDDFKKFISDEESHISSSQKRKYDKQGAELIHSDNEWKIYHITTYEASVYYGKNTEWCISGSKRWSNGENGEKYFNDYTKRGVEFYFYIKRGSEKYAVAYTPINKNFQIFDARDVEIKSIPQAPIIKELPKKVSSLGTDVFEIKDGILKKFNNTRGLTSIIIPDSVTSIGDYAFSGCTSLTSITIPDSVTRIGDFAFSGCTGLTNVTIGNGVTSIGYYAFSGCSSLTSITIPDSVTRIGDFAFSGCTGLTSITIPDSVTSIGHYAFSGCTSLTSITIPDSVTRIGDFAFSGCTGLTSITIPDSVTSIGYYAFSGCSSLTSIIIPDSVTSIGRDAFYGCTKLMIHTNNDYVIRYAEENKIKVAKLNESLLVEEKPEYVDYNGEKRRLYKVSKTTKSTGEKNTRYFVKDKDYEALDTDEDTPYTYKEILKEIKSITDDFADKEGTLRCFYAKEKDLAKQILKKHYKTVEVSGDDRIKGEQWYVIAYSTPISNWQKLLSRK